MKAVPFLRPIKQAFAYPSGQAIDLFNALYGEREIEVILPRHEQGLVHAADGVCYEQPMTICIFNNGFLGNVRQWQEMFYDKRYVSTCMRYRKSCPHSCNSPARHCPEYTPDFIRLAQSYGAKGIRVTRQEDIAPALKAATGARKAPVVIEFIMEPEENVMPIVPPGHGLEDMILENQGSVCSAG